MELTRRDFLALAAAAAPLAVSAPHVLFAAEERQEPARKPAAPVFEDAELPIQGFAGECSGLH
jgi:hypothetical protein